MSSLFFSLVVGAGLGALLGRFGQCSSGACPLTANWQRGALYGAAFGFIFHLGSGGALTPYPTPKNVKPIAEADFHPEVTQAGKPVVVDFYAPWCGPCKMLAPSLDRLASEFGDRVKFVSINVDQAQALAAKFNVRGVPTLLFIGRDGQLANTSVGLLPESELRNRILALAGG